MEQLKNAEEKSLRKANPLIVDLLELKIINFIYFSFYFIFYFFSIFELQVRVYYNITKYHITLS